MRPDRGDHGRAFPHLFQIESDPLTNFRLPPIRASGDKGFVRNPKGLLGTLKMVSELGVSAQVEGAQEALYAYWAGLRRDGRLPSRSDVQPGDLKSFLPHLSLIEADADRLFRVRLAGTGLYDVYGAEITGRTVREIYSGPAADYWRRELEAIINDRRPAIGAHSLGWRGAPHLSVLWMRLPLAANGQDVDMILGYDVVLGGEKVLSSVSGIRAA